MRSRFGAVKRQAAQQLPGDTTSAETKRGAFGGQLLRSAALIGAGLAMLVLGAHWIVDSTVAFAGALGVSQLLVSLTIVAVGTSLPELATSVIAGIRGNRDIAMGNLIGSNIFDILGVMGVACVANARYHDLPDSAST